MTSGLRVQILVLLGGVLVLAFVPLFHAVATYASYSLQRLQEEHAYQQAELCGRTLAVTATELDPEQVAQSWPRWVVAQGSEAALLRDERDGHVLRAGAPSLTATLESMLQGGAERREISSGGRRLLATRTRTPRFTTAVAVPHPTRAAGAGALVRLVALYMAVVALAMLVAAYFAMTRWLVRPLAALSAAAERVAGGARRLDVPRTRTRELVVLGQSLKTMTERLLGEEEALRRQIEEVSRAQADLAQAQQSLVRSERLASVGRLAAGLAHEVGNPIAALIGLQDMLLLGGLSPAEQHDFLRRMRGETERIHHIVRDLLQFARPVSARAGAEPRTPGDVAAAVDDTVALLKPQKSLQDVQLLVELAPELPLVALAREQLVQVLLNLLLNAADVSAPGGTIRVRAELGSPGVRVSVEDNGPGVPPEIQARLFEPFVTTKEVGKGTGLGLAVCQGIVESVGGSIELDASYAAGARFVIGLPCA